MQTLSHSQAAASGNFESPGAIAGRIARINESRALAASERGLFDGALKAIRTVAMKPERVQQLLATLNACLEADPQYLPGNGNYTVRFAVLTAFSAVQEDVSPDLEDLASLAGRVA